MMKVWPIGRVERLRLFSEDLETLSSIPISTNAEPEILKILPLSRHRHSILVRRFLSQIKSLPSNLKLCPGRRDETFFWLSDSSFPERSSCRIGSVQELAAGLCICLIKASSVPGLKISSFSKGVISEENSDCHSLP